MNIKFPTFGFGAQKAPAYLPYGLHEPFKLIAKADALKMPVVKQIAKVAAFAIDLLAAVVYNPVAFILNNTVFALKHAFHKEPKMTKNNKLLLGASIIALASVGLYFTSSTIVGFFKK